MDSQIAVARELLVHIQIQRCKVDMVGYTQRCPRWRSGKKVVHPLELWMTLGWVGWVCLTLHHGSLHELL